MLRRHPFAWVALIALLGVNGRILADAPAQCGVARSPRGEAFEVGMLFQALIPSGLPDLTKTIPVYGPVLGMPIPGGTLQAQTVFGSDPATGLTLQLIEGTYRLEIEVPFFNIFALFGAHYLRYSQSVTHAAFGANLGIGLSFLMGKNFELSFALRTYLQQRSTVSFGGGFSFLL